MSAEREIVLTLTDTQHQTLTRDIARIRKETGAASNTAAILDAVRQRADTKPSSPERKAAA
jgi:hypothetical protein